MGLLLTMMLVAFLVQHFNFAMEAYLNVAATPCIRLSRWCSLGQDLADELSVSHETLATMRSRSE